MMPRLSSPTRALPAAKTRTASIRSDSVGGVARGAGGGRMEKVVVVVDSGTTKLISYEPVLG